MITLINVEKVKLSEVDTNYLRFIRTTIKWSEVDSAYSLPKGYSISKEEIESHFTDSYLKISCSDGFYLHIPKIRGTEIQYTSSSHDNKGTDKLHIYENSPHELYIDIKDELVGMSLHRELIKKYIIDVRSETHERIQKYGLILMLEYKDNGRLKNPDYAIEVLVAIHKLHESSMFLNAVDITFWALVIYQLFMLSLFPENEELSIGYVEVAIAISYFAQLIYRSKHIGNTIINRMWIMIRRIWLFVIKRKKSSRNKNRFSLRAFEIEISSKHKVFINQSR